MPCVRSVANIVVSNNRVCVVDCVCSLFNYLRLVNFVLVSNCHVQNKDFIIIIIIIDR